MSKKRKKIADAGIADAKWRSDKRAKKVSSPRKKIKVKDPIMQGDSIQLQLLIYATGVILVILGVMSYEFSIYLSMFLSAIGIGLIALEGMIGPSPKKRGRC